MPKEPDGRARILVVDDDRAIRDSLRRALSLHGFDVDLASDGMEAIRLVASESPDAIVLDVAMPGVNGFGVTRRLRQDGVRTPILMLTAKDAVPERVSGLEAGADDYLVKPFALEELIARLRVMLRRTLGEEPDPQVLRFADLRLDRERVEVTRDGRCIELTPTEFDLLEVFLHNPRRVLSRDALHAQVWGYDTDVAMNTVEVYVGYLRRKLESEGEPRLIHTVRGFGYVLREA